MAVTTLWSPNQSAVAQVVTYTFTAPSSIGNTYTAKMVGPNGVSKEVTYSSVSGDTAATVASAMLTKLQTVGVPPPEMSEITFTNPSSGVLVATAQMPGVPFANVTVDGVSGMGLVLTTGNGLANGITTANTTANKSPSDVNDAQNWVRTNMATTPPSSTRAIPQNADDVVISNSAVPMLWNLDALATVQFNTYQRRQSMTGQIGLPEFNAGGYAEWRAKHFRFVGPQGSVPAGGLALVCGYDDNQGGSGPSLERYNTGSQPVTLTALAGGQIDWLGVHTANTFTIMGGVTLNVGMNPGEAANLTTSLVDGGCSCNIGPNVTWTAASTLTINSGSAVLNSAPATLSMVNGAQAGITTDSLTWTTITMQGGSLLAMQAGGTITTLTMTTGGVLDKSTDARALTITNSTIDGDTCQFIDPLNAITWTNATSVKQQVTSGAFQFTGTRTVKVT